MAVEDLAPILEGKTTKRNYKRASIEDAKKWADMYAQRMSILKIAESENVAPSTVSKWLRTVGIEVKQGQHFVEQPQLVISDELNALLACGTPTVINAVQSSIWGVELTSKGVEQLGRFCKFVSLHREGLGVEEISRGLDLHRSTVAEWRQGTDRPYLVKLAQVSLRESQRPGWKWLPLAVKAGGNNQSRWIQVPPEINHYSEVRDVIKQLSPLSQARSFVSRLGGSTEELEPLKLEFFGYLLGILLGDAGKRGGKLSRVSSMNIDLQLIKSKKSNLSLGEFVCGCCGLIGLKMHRVKDKPPSGDQLLAAAPSYAYRWLSERSPLIAWMFHDCLGLEWSEVTSTAPVRMAWFSTSPQPFRKRFVQGLSDSDGTVRSYSVEIASMPNAEFVTQILRELGMTTAYTRFESGKPMRTVANLKEARELPMFNEFSDGYRYRKLRGLDYD